MDANARREYDPPDWLAQMQDAHERRMKAKRGRKARYLTGRQILRKIRKAGW